MTYTSTKHPHVPAAFINAIREEGTKKEACDFLQAQWNETFALSAQLTTALDAVEQADKINAMWKQNSKDTWSAICATRNDLNEHIKMPSLESDLLQGPEDSVFFAVVVEAVVAGLSQARADGYVQGLRDADAVCVNTDFNYSDEVRVRAQIKHRILALIPAGLCDTKSAENVTQAGLCQSNAHQAIKPTPAPADKKVGTE